MVLIVTSAVAPIAVRFAHSASTSSPAPSAIPGSLSAVGLLWWVGVALVIAMIFVLGNALIKRNKTGAGTGIPLPSSIRAWMAIALIVGLVIYTGASLGGQDESVRSALVGGLVAAVASATAYFFATVQAEGALNAVTGATSPPNAVVPDLEQKTLHDALATVGSTNFKLVVDAASVPAAATPAVVAVQDQKAGTSIPGNSEILVKLEPAAVPPVAATKTPATVK